MTFDTKFYNPNGIWLLKAMNDPTLRYIVMQGGSSSAKSFSYAQVCLWQTILDKQNTLIFRKIGATLEKSIYTDFRINAEKMTVNGKPAFTCITNKIRCYNGAYIDFTGIDDAEKIKGISNYKRIFMDELTEFLEQDWRQIRTRMRGKEGQQLYSAFNPISENHWIKRKVYDCEKWHEVEQKVNLFGVDIKPELCKLKSVKMGEPVSIVNPRTGEVETLPPNFMWLESTYLNNFWVVGSPDGTYGYYDAQCIANYEADKRNDPDYYRVYALGEWGVIRTGGEFLPKFSMQKVGKFPYNGNLPVHVSVDNNVLPYITTTLWQYDINTKSVSQFAEVCAEDPENTASRAGELVAEYLHSLGVEKVYLHGDVTTKAASTIDDEKRSFFDKYMEKLADFDVEDCTGSSNPSVRASGEFVNALFDGWNGFLIGIDESCKHSIEDYLSVKKDVNGGLLKVRVKDSVTKQSYEQYGHNCDTMRYVLCDILKNEYTSYSLRRKHNTHTELNYIKTYEAKDKFTFIIPSFDDKASLIVLARVGDVSSERLVVEKAIIRDTMDAEFLAGHIEGNVIFESEKPFFDLARKLRGSFPGLVIKSPKTDADERIKATTPMMSNVYFIPTEDGEYLSFIDNLQDYNGRESRHASNIIACALKYLARH